MSTLLEIKNLSLHYKQDKKTIHVINDVTLTLEEGDALGIVGESGCGKSTLARAIIRLLPDSAGIDKGQILYKGNDINKMNAQELRALRGKEIGMIMQNPMTALNPTMKLRDQIYEVLAEQGYSGNAMKERAIELFKLVGISAPEKRLNEYIHQFSGGMRQRAMIAIVLASNPKLLIADEPTTALDVTIQKQIIKLLKRLRKELGMTIILITHDLGVVSEICDKVAVMYAGKLVETGSKKELFTNPAHPYTRGLLNSLPKMGDTRSRLESIDGMPPSLAEEVSGCLFAPRCSICREACRQSKCHLIEVSPGHYSACECICHENDPAAENAVDE